MKSRFKRLYEELDDKQREAVDSQTSTVVIAGPGSGKTRIICLKAVKLFMQELGIACISYNNAAVEQLREELALLGLREGERCYVGTVHAFCLANVILPFRVLFPDAIPQNFGIASESQALDALYTAILSTDDNSLINQFQGEDEDVKKNLINLYRRVTVNRRHFVAGELIKKDKVLEAFDIVMRSRKLLDFEMIVETAIDCIRKSELVQRYLFETFSWMLIDEYQDLGGSLHTLALLLNQIVGIQLFVVGDPNQQIYEMAANEKYLKAITELDGFGEPIETRTCYRFGEKLIRASASILRRNRMYDPGKLTPRTNVLFHQEPDLYSQSEWIIEQLVPELIEECNGDAEKIAVLYRQQGEVPDTFRNILDTLRTSNNSSFEFFDERISDFPSSGIVDWIRASADWSLAISARQPESLNRFSSVSDYYIEMHRGAGRNLSDEEKAIVDIELMKVLLENKPSDDIRASQWIKRICSQLRVEELLFLAGNRNGEIGDLKELIEVTCRNKSVAEITLSAKKGKAIFTTVHSSKGREFDHVILFGLQQGIFPWFGKQHELPSRRLFYVACTRARKRLYLVYSDVLDMKMSWGVIQSVEKSPFIAEVKGSLTNFEYE